MLSQYLPKGQSRILLHYQTIRPLFPFLVQPHITTGTQNIKLGGCGCSSCITLPLTTLADVSFMGMISNNFKYRGGLKKWLPQKCFLKSSLLPSAIKYQNILIKNITGLKEAGLGEKAYANQKQVLEAISEHINTISDNVEKMIEERKKANEIKDTRAMAIAYCDNVKGKYFDIIRYHVDKLELLVDDAFWLLPKYRELLFLR